jgi:hypothetical protein
VAQVANHVLTGGDVEELLEALHPRPEEVDRAALYGDEPKRPGPVAGLRTYARRLSTIVCGGRSGAGRPPRRSQKASIGRPLTCENAAVRAPPTSR